METKLTKNLVSIAQKVLSAESEAIQSLISTIDEGFIELINEILNLKGKVVVSGIGKSAIIAQKMVATFNSTGQPSVFLHAADALHGDLGILAKEDIVICLSKSGDTPEIKSLVPMLQRNAFKLVAMVCNKNSYLAQNSDFVLHIPIEKEACPLNLAPTTSTTAMLAMGDAVAMTLLESRDFTPKDFAKFHPGGSLGKKLYLKVKDVYKNNAIPCVSTSTLVKEIIFEISSKRLGITAVVNDSKELVGVVTDGDLRRMLDKYEDYKMLKAEDIMTHNPKTIAEDEYAVNALRFMEDNSITQVVVSKGKELLGFVHLHDLLKEGLA